MSKTYQDSVITRVARPRSRHLQQASGIASGSPSSPGVTSVALTMPTGFDVEGSPITRSGELRVAFSEGYGLLTPEARAILDRFEYDAETHTLLVKKDGTTPVNFAAYGEVTAGGVGSDTPVATTTLGGLLNVTDSADDIQTADKILVRRANASGGNSWTLANLSDISGTVVGVRMNGVVKNPGTDKIVDLGTVLTEHQSLAGYQPLIDASHKLAYSLISGTPTIPTTLAELTGDTTHRIVTDSQITAWNGKQNALGYTPVNKAGDTITGTTIAIDSAGLPTHGGSRVPANTLAIGRNGIGIGGVDTSNDGAAIYMENAGTEKNHLIIALGDDAAQLGADDYIAFRYYNTSGQATYESKIPFKSGTIALTSDIPTDNNQLTNGAGYITSSGSCAYATSAGTATNVNGGYCSLENNLSNWNFNVDQNRITPLLTISGSATGSPGPLRYGYSFMTQYSGFQIVEYGGGDTFEIRGNADGVWKSWHELYHSGNCNNISTPWSASTLTLNGAISGCHGITFLTFSDSLDGAGNFHFGTGSGDVGIYIGSNYTNQLFKVVRSTGNTMVGPGNPAYKLDVAGNCRIAKTLYVDGDDAFPSSSLEGGEIVMKNVYNGTYNAHLDVYQNQWRIWANGSTKISADLESGNFVASGKVGIGTTNPTWNCSIVSSTGACNLELNAASSDSAILYITGSHSVSWSAGTNVWSCGTSFGWGTFTGPNANLHATLDIYGNFVANGEVTAGSDARWKHNITPVVNGIDAIMKLQPSEWKWNSDNHKGSGLIAQQVQAVLPHLVKEDGEGYLHLNYDGLHAYEISAIQSHETEIDRLRKKVAYLESEVQRLRS